jgi:hypothetical protein
MARLKKLNQIELKRRKLRILRELGKTYLKILIKIKAIKMDKKLNNSNCIVI